MAGGVAGGVAGGMAGGVAGGTVERAGARSGLLAEVGKTPLVRLRRVVEGAIPPTVEVHAKLEWLNPGGSVKDRAALAMVEAAESAGTLAPGQTMLDASSGNTGIALAMIAAARGYRLTLCIPGNASVERKRTLRAYGANLIETSPLEGSDGAIRRARGLAAEDPRLHYIDQYGNPANWRAHFASTGPEIWADTGGRVSHFVATLGTSGTFVGTTRYLKERRPDLVAVSVEPDSPFHGLEGLKHMETAIVPPIYDPALADRKLGAPTEEARALVKRLAAEEGLFAGISSGAALWGAFEVARGLERGVVVTVFPDGGGRYLSDAELWA